MSKIKLECHEANHICDKNQYQEAKFWEKVRLTVHLIYCRACKEYTKRNNKLTKVVKNPTVNNMEKSAKEQLNTAFEKELVKHQ